MDKLIGPDRSMNRTPIEQYDLSATLMSGQAFVWHLVDGWFVGGTLNRAVKMRQEEGNLIWQTYPQNDDWDWLSTYLRLDVDYQEILNKISLDENIRTAISRFPDLRLLRQDFEEALISFLCSPMKSIVGIRQCNLLMSEKFGEKVDVDGSSISLLPAIERLAEVDLQDLLTCKVCFRGRNIIEASKYLLKTGLSDQIQSMTENEARTELLKIRGVGDKVADCGLVYGLGHDNVTPLDVWMWRVARDMYGHDESMRYDQIRRWFADYFDGYASWAAQFLFEYIRTDRQYR